MPSSPRVVAVVVTWNRRELLLRSLAAVLGQEPAPTQVVVVDNASTDGSGQAVQERFPQVDLVSCEANTGGAGGFALGIARAIDLRADAVWIMDDDTIPQPGALAALLDARRRYAALGAGSRVPAVIASRVEWTDGRAHPMNTPREKPLVLTGERADARAVDCLPIRTASFVSLLLDARRIEAVGLPVADYFLWNDDFEYTARLLRNERGLLCPASLVRHETKVFGGADADPGERFRFEVRNKVWVFTRSGGLAAGERLMYAGSSLRRWLRTWVRSSDRATLRRAGWQGLREGFGAPPRPTAQVLAQASPSTWPSMLGERP